MSTNLIQLMFFQMNWSKTGLIVVHSGQTFKPLVLSFRNEASKFDGEYIQQKMLTGPSLISWMNYLFFVHTLDGC